MRRPKQVWHVINDFSPFCGDGRTAALALALAAPASAQERYGHHHYTHYRSAHHIIVHPVRREARYGAYRGPRYAGYGVGSAIAAPVVAATDVVGGAGTAAADVVNGAGGIVGGLFNGATAPVGGYPYGYYAKWVSPSLP